MAKSKTSFRDKFERKTRLANRPPRDEEEFDETRPWLYEMIDEDVADEISSYRTNAAY